jgi:hypothetical protein
MLLINCMDGDMLEPYIQGGSDLFANQGILMLHDLISTHQSSSSNGLVSILTWFIQARMLPTETIIQYCSKILSLSTELGRLGHSILEPLLRLFLVHGLTPKFAGFSSQVATSVIDVVHGFNSWGAFIRRFRDYATHLNIRPAPSNATSADIDPSDLVWLGQPGLDMNQTDHLMTLFTFPIHRSDDHTLDRCGAMKRLFAVSPNTNSAPYGSTRRGGDSGTRDSDGGRRQGHSRGYQRRSDSDSHTDAAPAPTPTPVPSQDPRLPQDSRRTSTRQPKHLSHT